ncbi:MAG: lasso peptide biosynthesis B2 protein [Chloroflexota bacterium]|nr:MAG: lasso peptide biosynthesis B2 protein [Chloroflexota bacterium]
MRVLSMFRRYAALSNSDRWLYLRAFAHLVVIDVGLKLLGYQRVLEKARPIADPERCSVSKDDYRRARRYARVIESASHHHFIRAQCLHRSLGLHHWLLSEGLPSELRIGVRKEHGALAAHAWVELAGYVVHEEAASVAPFTPLGNDPGKKRPAPILHVGAHRPRASSDAAPRERQ